MKTFPKWATVLLPTVGMVVLFLLMLTVQVYSDHGFICENTGSKKGHREWWFGIKTGEWYNESSLETFMADSYPDTLTKRWTSYQGTGRNIFGRALLHGHGYPGPILGISNEIFNEYVEHLDEPGKKALYDTFKSSDRQMIKQTVDQILNWKWQSLER